MVLKTRGMAFGTYRLMRFRNCNTLRTLTFMAQTLCVQVVSLVTAYLIYINLVIYLLWQVLNVELKLLSTAVKMTRNVNIPHSTTFVIPDWAGRRATAVTQRAAPRNGGAKTGLKKRFD